MSNASDCTLDLLYHQLIDHLGSGNLEEAIEIARAARRYGSTLSPLTYGEWLNNTLNTLKRALPYPDYTLASELSIGLIVNQDSYGIKLVAALSECFFVLGATSDAIRASIWLHCHVPTNADVWLELLALCLQEKELLLAETCSRYGIRILLSDAEKAPHLDEDQRSTLLTLWISRVQVFELQKRTSDAIAAFQVYEHLKSKFDISYPLIASEPTSTTSIEPMEVLGKQKLDEKRRLRSKTP